MTGRKKYLVVVMGPTAAGKTAAAISIASYFHTEIISSDSRQFYSEMKTGTAMPTEEELRQVPHHFIGHISIHQPYSAGDFERDALGKLNELFRTHDIVVMAGGSGLYNKAVLEGLDDMPGADANLRATLQSLFEKEGIGALQEMLKELDPVKYSAIDIKNTQRVMRAIEIAKQNHHSVSKIKTPRHFIPIKIGITLPREILYDRINKRVDDMMKAGLVEEARKLHPYKQLNALQTVGYTELFAYFEGKTSQEKAVALIRQRTRNFAKRQLTWLRKETDIHWFGPEDTGEMIHLIETATRSS